jgi:hypothetical protein
MKFDKRWQREILRWIVVAIVVSGASCAHGPVTAPSTAAVQGSITGAKRYNDIATVHNANATTRVERIEAKTAVIEKYWGK